MPKYRFKVTDRHTPEGWWEEYSDNAVNDKGDSVMASAKMIADFNDVERDRYGDKAALRTIVAVEFLGGGPVQHDYRKMNIMTVAGDGHGPRDIWECSACGCRGLRYGLSQTIKRTGKWRALKYQFCLGKEVES